MKFDREVHEAYQQANALAMRCQAKAVKNKLPTSPVALNTLIDNNEISCRQDLGVIDIPTNLIAGVAEATEKSILYTKELLPVSTPHSEYADAWRDIYLQYFRGGGVAGQIQCHEYLGKFYIIDGLKRASVVKFLKKPTISAHVIRMMPNKTGARAVQLYYDFLFQFRLTGMYQLQFTQEGFFEKFQKALGKESGEKWTDDDRCRFFAVWCIVEDAFRKSYEECLHITAADALVVLLEKYSFEQIANMQSWILPRVFQSFWKELYALSFPDVSVKADRFYSRKLLQTA
ncbi:MAG: hypothetical protein J6C98_00465 [Oscillospiraceae bacterium]|nr:hypothetical protein [Oscillospiraceae bacterium]